MGGVILGNLPQRKLRIAINNRIREETDAFADEMRALLERTIATWDRREQIEFVTEYSTRTDRALAVRVYTTDFVYNLLDRGTNRKNYTFGPSSPNIDFLQYRRQFVPKTTPDVLASRQGGKYGAYTRRLEVTHPGFEARNFYRTVVQTMNRRNRSLGVRLVAGIESVLESRTRSQAR